VATLWWKFFTTAEGSPKKACSGYSILSILLKPVGNRVGDIQALDDPYTFQPMLCDFGNLPEMVREVLSTRR
jgi:hypothetical protein